MRRFWGEPRRVWLQPRESWGEQWDEDREGAWGLETVWGCEWPFDFMTLREQNLVTSWVATSFLFIGLEHLFQLNILPVCSGLMDRLIEKPQIRSLPNILIYGNNVWAVLCQLMKWFIWGRRWMSIPYVPVCLAALKNNLTFMLYWKTILPS